MAQFEQDESTGDYVMQTGTNAGKPAIDTSLRGPARALLRCHRGEWMHAPDGDYGSDFFRYKKRKSTDFRDGIAETLALRALDRLRTSGRADNLEAFTQFAQRGGVAVGVRLLDRQQQQEYDVTTQIGVPR